eukprot:TRINITY_DN2482_c1_g1_i1.p1 TRINITY_DN2482_c1_g1~~TRINITY_DN2482_c1_g1_i1.p1  ORF type:complete len:374 (+),score=54.29 TRINITY_DN2482_c1_g1_i1:154-1122(+)
MATELRKQTLFHYSDRVVGFAKTYEFHNSVRASELAGTGFEVRFPLGRAWHETTFMELIESQWSFFGLFDLLAKDIGMMGQAVDSIQMKGGTVEHRPVRVPRLRCSLEISDGGRTPNLQVHEVREGGKRRSSIDLALAADTCGMLGVAAGYFHSARYEIRDMLRGGKLENQYQSLANYTAGCFDGSKPEVLSSRQCSSKTFKECSALADNGRAVPRHCLRIRKSPGSGVRIRRRVRFSDMVAVHNMIEQGERLLREFIDRHGLYVLVWSTAREELAPPRKLRPIGAELRWPTKEEIADRETIWTVLQDIQNDIMASEEALGD